MTRRTFFDTNVLIYADDASAGKKQKRAQALLEEALRNGSGVVSTQVLQEYFVAATRKLGMKPTAARGRVEAFLGFDVIPVSSDLILQAIDLHRLDQISFWDALIVRTATASDCEVLLSEDLQHGRTIDGMEVRNPFQ